MLDHKVILVVGGGSGIGLATALECRTRGAAVVVADLRSAPEWDGDFVTVDVTDEARVVALMAEVERRQGRLDALIHTAGLLAGPYVPLEDFSLEVFRQVQDVNVVGSFLCAKHAAPLLRRSPRGVIVLVSSMAATAGSSSYAYGTSKGAVTALGVTLANKLAAEGIRVNVVAPGNIDTPMKRRVIEAEAATQGPGPQSRLDLGDPAGVGRVLAWLASDDADYVRGIIYTR
jgi:NAD(P)-dependent dehydrogenase (short-subunit alcohol dehydrogenase family)